MQQSLALAAQAVGLSNPNPAVGCVLVDAQGRVIGQGHTQAVGGPHAEVMALRDAAARGHAAQALRGATAYVTLEPCAHHGRTPPCCDALIAAGVGKVVASLIDPNPQVAGQGLARLRAAGIAVEVGDGAAQSAALNLGFLQRMRTGLPWVRSKIAASMDGFTALPDGQSQWITGAAARADGWRWRLRACVVLTGIGTVLADDPLLNVRTDARSGDLRSTTHTTRQPPLVVLDSQWRTPPDARLWQAPQRPVWIFGSARAQDAAALARREILQTLSAQTGGQTVAIESENKNESESAERVDVQQVIARLAAWPVNEIHVEAGATLNGALMRAGVIDECLLYLAPKWLGAGRPMLAGWGVQTLAQAPGWHWLEHTMTGEDLRVRLAKHAPLITNQQ